VKLSSGKLPPLRVFQTNWREHSGAQSNTCDRAGTFHITIWDDWRKYGSRGARLTAFP